MIIRRIINAHKDEIAIEGIGRIEIKFFSLGEEGGFRDLFEIATMQARGETTRVIRVFLETGARKNDSMAPRVRIPTRHELPNDASLLCAPLSSRPCIETGRDGTGRDVTRRRKIERIASPALFHDIEK